MNNWEDNFKKIFASSERPEYVLPVKVNLFVGFIKGLLNSHLTSLEKDVEGILEEYRQKHNSWKSRREQVGFDNSKLDEFEKLDVYKALSDILELIKKHK